MRIYREARLSEESWERLQGTLELGVSRATRDSDRDELRMIVGEGVLDAWLLHNALNRDCVLQRLRTDLRDRLCLRELDR